MTYPDIDDEKLQQKLLNKTEFSIINKNNEKNNVYFTFQRNIAILLSPVTPYKKMLFYWEPGVGKSLASILVHELTKQFLNNDFRQTIIITKGKSLEDNYKAEFLKVHPGLHFQKDEHGEFIDKLGVNREIKANFIFKKYAAFAKFLSKVTNEFIERTYSNRIFILDEAHAIKNYKSDTYKQYKRLFTHAKNPTIILLTGTPNTDHPSEGIALVNLLKDDQMIVGPKFLTKYYKDNKFKWEKESELLEFYHGYVTYLTQTSNIKPSKFITNPEYPNEFTTFSTYNVFMNPFQEQVYNKAIIQTHKAVKTVKGEFGINILQRDKDGNLIEYESKQGGAFMKLAREAEMFCYPDGTFGAEGFKKNMKKDGNDINFQNKETADEFKKNLKKYSATFFESFEIIKANPKRVFYIYFDNVNNSGLLMYAKLLEIILGFVQTDSKKQKAGGKPKYIRIDGSVKNINSLLEKVGSKENADGSLVRVILGSPVSGVGLTIPNATICMIFDAQFTPSDIVQITNRINRPGTLENVKNAGLPIDCQNYLFTASTNDKKSVSLDIYRIAQTKISLIEPQTELMKRADPFCAVSYNRNLQFKKGKPINYECWSAFPNKKDTIWTYNRKDDITTDVLFWREDEIQKLYDEIIEKVKEQPVKISDYIKTHDPMIVYRTVKKIAASTKVVKLKDNTNGIIFINNDLIFADITCFGDLNVSWYIQTKTFPTQIMLDDILANDAIKSDKNKIQQMIRTKDLSIFNKLSKYSKIILWEKVWENELDLDIKDKMTSYEVDGIYYHILYAEPYNPPVTANANSLIIEDKSKIRVFDSKWKFYHGDADNLLTKFKIEQKTKINKVEKEIDPKWGMYGKYDKKGNFQIVIMTSEGTRANTGKRCAFFKKPEQQNIYSKFKKVPANFADLPVEDRCAALEALFKENDLIIS